MSNDASAGTSAPAPDPGDKPKSVDLVKTTSSSLNKLVDNGGASAFNFLVQYIYDSKWFNAKSLGSAAMVLSTMLIERLSPVMFKAKYWMMDGGPTMRADYMLAEFNRNFGVSQLIHCNSEGCQIELKKNGAKKGITFSRTWEETLKEPYVWTKDAANGRTPKFMPDGTANPAALKDNYATPLGRQDMMWARLISGAIRKIAPEVNGGMYTPEELDPDFVDAEIVETTKATAKPAESKQADPAPSPVQEAKSEAPLADEPPAPVISSDPPFMQPEAEKPAEPKKVETPKEEPKAAPAEAAPSLSDVAAMTDEQRINAMMPRLRELKALWLTPEQWKQLLHTKYRDGKNMTADEVAHILTGLESHNTKMTQADNLDEFANRALNPQ